MNGLLSRIFHKPVIYANFEDVQFAAKHPDTFILINTLPIYEQTCLIRNTVFFDREENLINELLTKNLAKKIVVYGANDVDDTVDKKYQQLVGLGFVEVAVYRGGMFEWLLLQDVYGATEFPTTSKMLDLLKYRPRRTYETRYLL
jgi:hypothetical protein